ncbi:hypothetical protein [Paracoccus indicus]|nr:hypothetical protein [Paracoccus indicus]
MAAKIINNAGTQLQAAKLWAGHGSAMPMLPKVGGGAADIEGKAE